MRKLIAWSSSLLLLAGCPMPDAGGPSLPVALDADGTEPDAGTSHDVSPGLDVSEDPDAAGIAGTEIDRLIDMHCDRLTLEWCRAYYACDEFDPRGRIDMLANGVESCVRSFRYFGRCAAKVGLELGTVTVDPGRLAECLGRIDEGPCETAYAECAWSAFAGEAAAGADCRYDLECRGDLRCLGTDYQGDAPNGCTYRRGQCAEPASAGAACRTHDQCSSGHWCVDGACVRAREAGEACDAATPCDGGLHCIPTADGSVCSRGLQEGERCIDESTNQVLPCAPELECETSGDGTCRPVVPAGGACEFEDTCASGRWCPNSGVCPVHALEGESCAEPHVHCHGEGECVDGTCHEPTPPCGPGEITVLGECVLDPGVERGCEQSEDCAWRMVCDGGECRDQHVAEACRAE